MASHGMLGVLFDHSLMTIMASHGMLGVLFDHSLLHYLQLPVQCDITIDTPTQTARLEPNGNETGDLDQCLAQLATLQAEHDQCGSYQEELAYSQSEDSGEAAIGTGGSHAEAGAPEDSEETGCPTPECLHTAQGQDENKQLMGDRKGRKVAYRRSWWNVCIL